MSNEPKRGVIVPMRADFGPGSLGTDESIAKMMADAEAAGMASAKRANDAYLDRVVRSIIGGDADGGLISITTPPMVIGS